MTEEILNCFRVLDLNPGASAKEVRQARRDLAKVWHPDRFANDPNLERKAQERLKQINLAYEKLQDYLTECGPTRTGDPSKAKQNSNRSHQKQEGAKKNREREGTAPPHPPKSDPQPERARKPESQTGLKWAFVGVIVLITFVLIVQPGGGRNLTEGKARSPSSAWNVRPYEPVSSARVALPSPEEFAVPTPEEFAVPSPEDFRLADEPPSPHEFEAVEASPLRRSSSATPAFDPSKPYEVLKPLPAFDPSKPYEVLEPLPVPKLTGDLAVDTGNFHAYWKASQYLQKTQLATPAQSPPPTLMQVPSRALAAFDPREFTLVAGDLGFEPISSANDLGFRPVSDNDLGFEPIAQPAPPPTQIVEVPDVGEFEFPGDFTPGRIKSILDEKLPGIRASLAGQQTSQLNPISPRPPTTTPTTRGKGAQPTPSASASRLQIKVPLAEPVPQPPELLEMFKAMKAAGAAATQITGYDPKNPPQIHRLNEQRFLALSFLERQQYLDATDRRGKMIKKAREEYERLVDRGEIAAINEYLAKQQAERRKGEAITETPTKGVDAAAQKKSSR